MTDYSPFEQRVVDQLRLFLGDDALTAYERCGRSMQRLSNLARESSHPGYRLLAAGLALAQEALAEPMREAPESRGGGRDHGAQHCEQVAEPWMSQVVDATHLKHNRQMKSSILPQVRVDPKLREDAESLLRSGESLSEFIESTVRSAVDYRRAQAEFHARGEAAWLEYAKTGESHQADEVIGELRERLGTRRQQLTGSRKP